MWTLGICQWCRAGFAPLLSVMCRTVFSFSKLEVVLCKKSQQEPGGAPSWRHCADDSILLLCEAAALSLRLFMVCWPGARVELLLSLEVA